MDCFACGVANRDGAKFCSDCGHALGRACASCGNEVRAGAKFCDECGTAVDAPRDASPADGEAARKTVTVLFCDLVGSTAFGERVDAESTRDALAEYHQMARAVIEDHAGTVAKFIGDGVMALFGVPVTAEDDARRAVLAGVALQAAFEPIARRVARRHDVELGLRVGINTGEVVIAAADDDVVGDALNTAARLEAACEPGRVLVGEDTWRLTRSGITYHVLGEVDVRGKDEPVATFEVVSAAEEVDDLNTPFVGRADELTRLAEVFDEAVEHRSARMATVIGSPGVGKTRLSRELRSSLGDRADVVEIRCRRSGTATFAPIGELLRTATGVTDDDPLDEVLPELRALVADLDDADRVADLLASFVGSAPARSTEEAFFAVRRLIEATARRRGLVLIIDDIQWAEPLFLDLLEHLADWVGDAPTMILALARPEIREIRPGLGAEGRLVRAAISLEGLDAASTAEFAAKLVGADSLPSELVERLPTSTEGNPLFVRELMRMLVDDGVIVHDDHGWQLTIEADAVEVPPTIQSLLSARLDRMAPEERHVIELASVVGSEFPLGAILEISGDSISEPMELRRVLNRLRERELVEPAGTFFGDESVYRFHHVLIRDAAYRRLLKRVRARLHVQVGEWFERVAADVPGEHEARTAYHYECAHRYRTELSEAVEETERIGRRAAELLSAAARASLDRDDIAAAGTLVERALRCVPDDGGDDLVVALLSTGCEALLAFGDAARGAPLVERLARVAGDDVQRAWAACYDAQLAVLTAPGQLPELVTELDDAARRLAELGDDSGVAKARLVRAGALARLGRIGESEAELDLALTAARGADDRRRVAAVLGVAPVAALWGPSPIPRAGGRCLDVVRLLRIATGSPAVEAVSTRCQAVLEALRGRFDTARSMLADARATVEELGLQHGLLEIELYSGIVELLVGDAAAAEPALRIAFDGFAALGIDADAGHAAAYLARALARLGRLDDAAEMASVSDALAGQNPQTGIAARTVQAEVLAALGDVGAALELAREAVTIAAATDLVIDHADASAVLATVAAAAGHAGEAERAARAAIELYESKAAVVDVSQLDEVVAATWQVASSEQGADRHETPSGDHWNDAERITLAAWEHLWRPGGGSSYFAPGLVWDDRRKLIGGSYEGLDAIERRYLGGTAAGTGATRVATRGERLVLWRNTIDVEGDATIAVDYIVVLRIDERGLIDRAVMFDPDQLEAAIAEIDSLYVDQLVAEGRIGEAVMIRGTSDGTNTRSLLDVDRFLSYVAPDGVWVDHRDLGWPTLTMSAAADRLATLGQLDGELSSYIERFVELDPTAAAFQHANRFVGRDGSTMHDSSFTVTRSDPRTGLVDRIEQYAIDDLAAVRRRYSELRRAETASLWNVVSAAAAQLHSAVAEWDVLNTFAAASSLRIVDGVDHAVVGELDDLTDVDAARQAGLGARSHEVIAVRGDLLAVVSVRDVEGVDESEWFVVVEADQGGRIASMTRFPYSLRGLSAAADLLDERWAATLGPDERLTADPWVEFCLAWRSGDTRRLRASLEDDFSQTDHRMINYTPSTADEFVETYETLAATGVGRGVFMSRREPSVGSGAALLQTVVQVLDDGALFESNVATGVFGVRDGRLAFNELWEPDDHEVALRRFRELTGEPNGERRRRPASEFDTTVAQVVARADVAMHDGTFADRVDEFFEPDLVRDDRRQLGTGLMERDDVALHIGAAVGSRHEHDVLALRGDDLILERAVRTWDNGAESRFILVQELGPTRRIGRVVVFDEGDLDAAYDLLDERWMAHMSERDRADAEFVMRYIAASAGDDPDGFADLHHSDFVLVDHRRPGYGSFDRDGYIDDVRSKLATMGRERFRLVRRDVVGPGVHLWLQQAYGTNPDGLDFERLRYVLGQVADGRMQHMEVFDAHERDAALARARLLVLPDHPRWRVLARLAAVAGLGDRTAFDDVFHPRYGLHDHRQLGFGALGRDEMVEMLIQRSDVRERHRLAAHHLSDRVLVCEYLVHGSSNDHGVDFEEASIQLFALDGGLIRRQELFALDGLDAALASAQQIDEIGFDVAESPWFDTLAVRRFEAVRVAANDGSLAGRLDELFEPDFVREDRRTTVSFPTMTAAELAAVGPLGAEQQWEHRPIAVRGEHLALNEGLVAYGGGYRSDLLLLVELGPSGYVARITIFDEADRDTARRELERAWWASHGDAGRATLRVLADFGEAFRSQDESRLRQVFDPRARLVSHLPLERGDRSLEEYLPMHRERNTVFDVESRVNAVVELVSPEVAVVHNVDGGRTAEGADWELVIWLVFEVEGGRIVRQEVFEESDFERAMGCARRLALRGDPALENSAMRHVRELTRAVAEGDLSARVDELYEPAYRRHDHRSTVELPEVDATAVAASFDGVDAQLAADEPVAVRGDRFAMGRGRIRYGEGSASEFLVVTGVSERGLGEVSHIFDESDRDGAMRCLEKCWWSTLTDTERETVHVVAEFGRAVIHGDSDGVRTFTAPDAVLVGRLPLERVEYDRESYIESHAGRNDIYAQQQTVHDVVELLAPDVLLARSRVSAADPDAPAWEQVTMNVFVVRDGLVTRLDVFGESEYEAAQAVAERWAQPTLPSADGTSEPSSDLENLVSDVHLELQEAMLAGSDYGHLFADDFVRHDRRTGVNAGDGDKLVVLDTLRIWREQGGVPTGERRVAIRGDRHALGWSSMAFEGGHTVISMLVLAVCSDEGQFTQWSLFDDDDLDAAIDELDRLWFHSLSPDEQSTSLALVEWAAAGATWDVERFDRLVSDEFEMFDLSAIGSGTIDRATFLASQSARRDLQGDSAGSLVDLIELVTPQVAVARLEVLGDAPQWGVGWEHRRVTVHEVVDGKVRRFGVFDHDDLEGARAWARGLALDGEPPAPPSSSETTNAAVAGVARVIELLEGDLDCADEFADDFVRRDRRGGVNAGLGNKQQVVESLRIWKRQGASWPHGAEVIAVRGDRHALTRHRVDFDDGRGEIVLIQVSVVSEAGLQTSWTLFDESDVDAAVAELDRRWFDSLSPAEQATASVLRAWQEATVTWDVDRIDRELLHEDCTSFDGTQLGGGPQDRTELLENMRVRGELEGHDLFRIIDLIEFVRPDVAVSRVVASGAGRAWGGGWERRRALVRQIVDGKVRRFGVFDHEDLEGARAWARSLT